MAGRHRRKRARRSFNLRRVRVAGGAAAGALAALDVTASAITASATDPYRLVTVDLTYQVIDLGAATDDGYEFGLAHSDYSATEIEECLEALSSIDLGNKVVQEQVNRLVRTIGVIAPKGIVGGGGIFNDGKPVKTKLNWRMSSGDILNLWVRNASQVVWTTGSVVTVLGNLWIKDV